MVVPFHFWLDCARIFIVLVLHSGQYIIHLLSHSYPNLSLGGAVVFTLLMPRIPCVTLGKFLNTLKSYTSDVLSGSANTCTDFRLAILANAWAVCALRECLCY